MSHFFKHSLFEVCPLDSSLGSISHAIASLENQDEAAAELIWNRYFQRLCNHCELLIYQRHQKHFSPDEIASSAFLALFDGIKQQRFHQVRNRDELWQMLTLIAARQAINRGVAQDRQRRGGGKVRGSSAFDHQSIDNVADYLQRELDPQEYLELEELSEQLLGALTIDNLKTIAIWRMAGYSNEEMAKKLGCSIRTVERKLNLIREIWSKQLDNLDE
jgi:DNA-directed RNA polymerase specialized sigma24 family protein